MNRPAASLLALLTALAFALPASGQLRPKKKKVEEPPVETVRYSYTKWSRAEPARYVLVPTATSIKKGDLKERSKALFKALVGAKRGSYGDARLAFEDTYKTSGEVFVWLDNDPKYAPYHPIVMAETTYTFTENGASKVKFLKKGVKGWNRVWTRADVPFSAYVLSVPLWQVLPPNGMSGALAQMPDGTLTSSDAAIAKLESGDKATIDAMWSYVAKGGAAALAALNAAPLLKMPKLADRLIPVLDSADTKLRVAALEGLAGKDNKTVNKALRKVMDGDPDPALRDKAAAMLAQSKDKKYSTAAQYHALRSKDPNIVIAAAKALGESKQKEATGQLVGVLTHESGDVRAAAIGSLVARKDLGLLVDKLGDGKLDAGIKLEIARALSAVKPKKTVHAALMYLAVSGKGDDSSNAATALARFDQGPTYSTLGKALKHPEAPTRSAAAESLAKLGKSKGLDALAGADPADAETGDAVRQAIRAIYGKQSLDFVLKGTKQGNETLKREAVATLGTLVRTKSGKKKRKQIIETLRPLSKSSDAEIRAAATRSFEEMAGDDVEADVMRLAADKAVEVQRATAHALRAFPGADAVKFLLGYMGGNDPEVLANASESLGILKTKEALNPVIAQLNHDDVRVRRAATGALVQIGSTLEKRMPLLSFFSERLFDNDGEVRLKAVEGLRLVKDPRTVTAMAALIQDPIPEVRKATLMAMADTGHVSAVDAIAGALEDDDNTIRKVAIDALQALKKKEAVPVLEKYADGEKDKTLAAAARKAIKALGG